jgi:SNF2 family DNA or RNA helicase
MSLLMAVGLPMPISGFTAVDLGYQKGSAVSNLVTRVDDPSHTDVYLQLFNQIWNDTEKVKDVTSAICDHIESVYQENSPERLYFQILYNIFKDFLEDLDQDALPNDLTGYKDSQVWNKLFNYQRDAALASSTSWKRTTAAFWLIASA